MREQLGSFLRGCLRRAGLDLKRFTPLNDPHLRRAELMRHERIDLVLDVGANEGQYGCFLRRYGYRGRIDSFEPSSGAFARLARRAAADPAWEVRRAALGAHPARAALYVSENSVSSSLLRPTARLLAAVPGSRAAETEEVEVLTLDGLDPHPLAPGRRALLKLDVQGAERDVLSGGTRTLAAVRLIEMELPLAPLYEGQADLRELLDAMGAHGFALASAAPNTIEAATGRLLELDGIFAREGGP